MKITAVIQARTSSTRLPNKVLLRLPPNSDISVIEHTYLRAKKIHSIHQVIVATSDDPSDDAIETLCRNKNIPFFRGSLNNVLSRFYLALENDVPDYVIRITSDCPCIDSTLIDDAISQLKSSNLDYINIGKHCSLPHGYDAEIFTFTALEKAFQGAESPYDKEHVTAYIKNNTNNTSAYRYSKKVNHPNLRLTLDTKQDHLILALVYELLYPSTPFFGINDIMNLFDSEKWLLNLNNDILDSIEKGELSEKLSQTLSLFENATIQETLSHVKKNYDE